MKSRLLSISIIALIIISVFTACSNGNEESDDKVSKSDNKVDKITTDELSKRLDDNDLVIIDIRNTSEYNGWKLNNISRGGHIKNAINIPSNWSLENNELKDFLNDRHITKDKEIVIYGVDTNEVEKMIESFKSIDYKNLYSYEDGILEWSKNNELPMDKLANYEKLVYPEWVNELINDKNPETYDNDKYVIFEVSWGDPKEYNKGHIPGAIHLDTNEIEEEPIWNRKSDEDLEEMLLKYGVTHDTTAIVYGSDSTAAARAASVMMYAGVEDVRLLDGGYTSWTSANLEIEKETNQPNSVDSFGVEVPANPQYIIDTDEVKEMLNDDDSVVVSIRSWEEYIGNTSGYNYIKPMGRIFGSKWGHAGSDPYHMEDFRNIDNTMRNYNEISKNWSEWGITKDKNVSFHCGTGWRASEAFFDAYLMGWDNIAVYDGGWFEWSMNEDNPVESGEPKK